MSGLFGGSSKPPPPKVVRMPVESDATVLAARERAKQEARRRSGRLSTILSDSLRAAGAHTLTVFGLHTPHSLADSATPDRLRDTLTSAVLTSLNSVLAEPIQDVIMQDSSGNTA